MPSSAQEKTEKNKDLEAFIDSALELGGNSSYVEIVNSTSLNSINHQVTVSVWIKATDFPNIYIPIIYKGDKRNPMLSNRSYVMFLRSDGVIQFASSPDGQQEKKIFTPTNAITLNKWHHVAGVVDTTKNVIKVFVDGNEVGFRDYGNSRSIHESRLPLRIGGSHEDDLDTHATFIGQIDEVSVWNVALTEQQIRTYMHERLTGDERGLVGYWKFDEAIDGTITDITPNENDGRLINSIKIVDYFRPVIPNVTPEQLEQITTVYENELVKNVDSFDLYRQLAEVYLKLGQTMDAERILLRALKANLKQTEYQHILRSLWQLYNELNALDVFITHLEELRTRLEGNSVYLELLGDAYRQIGKEEDAKRVYKEWIEIREWEVNIEDRPSTYIELAEKLLKKNIYTDMALKLVIKATETPTGTDYINTFVEALVVNEQFDSAYQFIIGVFDTRSLPFVERNLLTKVIQAGKNVKDKDGYINMLNRLIADIDDIPRSHLSTTMALAQFYEENDKPERANNLIRNTGFITEDAWMILGPFDNSGAVGFNTQYIKEELPQIDTTVEYDGKYGKISWKKCADDTLYGDIRLGKNINWAAAYAFATVTSPDEREVEFRFDSDDQGKIWLNGIEVFSHTKTFTAEIDNYIIPLKLSAGKNSILVKVCEEIGGWGFYLRITDKEGKPYDDLKIGSSDEY